jgi:putative ABC transport system ATP-binding protein
MSAASIDTAAASPDSDGRGAARPATRDAKENVGAGKALGEPVIELYGVQKDYKLEGGEVVPVLHSISMHALADIPPIRRGEFVVIRGASGSGKTTLLNLIGTVDKPTKGTIKILGAKVDEKTSDAFLADLRLRSLGFVFQSFNLLSNLTALENVMLPMDILGELPEKKRKERAIKLLRLVDLEDRQHHLPSELSGGEQQRVAVARSLANNPPVILGDELTASLDVVSWASLHCWLCLQWGSFV